MKRSILIWYFGEMSKRLTVSTQNLKLESENVNFFILFKKFIANKQYTEGVEENLYMNKIGSSEN